MNKVKPQDFQEDDQALIKLAQENIILREMVKQMNKTMNRLINELILADHKSR